MKDKKHARKVAGKFVVIISSTETKSEEDDSVSPLGTDDENEGSEAFRPTGEAAGSGRDSDIEVRVIVRKTTLESEREFMRRLDQGTRAENPFPPYTGPEVQLQGTKLGGSRG